MFIGGLIIVSMRPDKILNIGFDGGILAYEKPDKRITLVQIFYPVFLM